ncbi:MAG TPA: hypothetical protein VGS05_00375 [Candidatus Sulfotelmatobacter sp.]|nr:hypothetical protein [Candidatus Sulfotelmatobacter sp.]
MNLGTCCYEKEVVQALKSGHWPDGCTPDLRAHVAACASCGDLVLVTEAFQQARRESAHELPSGSPGLLWWRAQLRRRNAAAEKITRPITIAETFALIVTVLVASVFVGWQYGHGLRWGTWCSEETLARGLHLLSAGSAVVQGNLFVLLAPLAALALLGGVVLYLVSAKS